MSGNQLPGIDFDRLKRAVGAFVRELFPTLDYYKPHLYQVVSWDYDSQTGSVAPSATSSGMPPIDKCGIRSSSKVDLPDGFSVVVSFANGDPTLGYISHLATEGEGNQLDGLDLSRSDDTILLPVALNVARRVVRYGDTIMFPVSAGSVPTPLSVDPKPFVPGQFSKVKA